jgi:hypothetical protein
VTTARHVQTLREHFAARNYRIVEIEAPSGLQDYGAAREFYQHKIDELETAIARKGTRKSTNEERKIQIAEHRQKLCLLARLAVAKKRAIA